MPCLAIIWDHACLLGLACLSNPCLSWVEGHHCLAGLAVFTMPANTPYNKFLPALAQGVCLSFSPEGQAEGWATGVSKVYTSSCHTALCPQSQPEPQLGFTGMPFCHHCSTSYWWINCRPSSHPSVVVVSFSILHVVQGLARSPAAARRSSPHGSAFPLL